MPALPRALQRGGCCNGKWLPAGTQYSHGIGCAQELYRSGFGQPARPGKLSPGGIYRLAPGNFLYIFFGEAPAHPAGYPHVFFTEETLEAVSPTSCRRIAGGARAPERGRMVTRWGNIPRYEL